MTFQIHTQVAYSRVYDFGQCIWLVAVLSCWQSNWSCCFLLKSKSKKRNSTKRPIPIQNTLLCRIEIHVPENSQTCLSSVADSHSNRDRNTNFKTIILILYRKITFFSVNKRNASIRSNQWQKCMDGNTIVFVILTLSGPVMVLVMVLCSGS